MRILMTGVTGYIGSELARELLAEPTLERLTVIIRPQTDLPAAERWDRLVRQWRKFNRAPDGTRLARLACVSADLERVSPGDLPLGADYDVVIHAAASTDLGATLEVSRRANLVGTQRALALAAGMPGLRRFVHFSTAYVAGTAAGVVTEDDPPPTGFHNHYERSKRESEQCVAASGLPYTILRPSIVVGRSDNGYTPGMKVLYSVWRAWLSGVIPRAPIDPKAWVDIVPVDFVTAATRALMLHPAASGRTLHLCAGGDRQSPKAVMSAAAAAFQVPLPPVSPPWAADVLMMWPVRNFLPPELRLMLETMHWHLPYLGIRNRLFDMRETDRLLGPAGLACPRFGDYGVRLFRYCLDSVWGKRVPAAMRADAAVGAA